MSDNKTYSCLLFDMDGTIADTSEGIYNGLRYMALKIGIPALSEDVMHTFLGPPLTGSLMRNPVTGKDSGGKQWQRHDKNR